MAVLPAVYTLIAQTGVTPIPGGTGTFTGFGYAPAVDSLGNVVFTGAGASQSGIYVHSALGLQKVADKNTPVPSGTGNFADFSVTERSDIDAGRVVFKGTNSANKPGLYTNAGQASASDLVRVALVDSADPLQWQLISEPWLDGNVVAFRGTQLGQVKYDRWAGADTIVTPGAGYSINSTTQAAISGPASVFLRNGANVELAVSSGGAIEPIAVINITDMPGLGVKFQSIGGATGVANNGQDLVFGGYGSQKSAIFKRVNGGPLLNVADNTKPVPGVTGDTFKIFNANHLAIANGKVAFVAYGQYTLKGLYTDVGGTLACLFDDEVNNHITVSGQPVTIGDFYDLGTRSLAYTPQGYQLVFRLNFNLGGGAIIKATFGDPPPPPDVVLLIDGNVGKVYPVGANQTSLTFTAVQYEQLKDLVP